MVSIAGRSREKEPPLSDEELFAIIRERLFTAVIGDVMDAAGLTRQFLPPGIRALQPDSMVVGRAMTVLEADTEYGQDAGFGLMFRALDDLTPGEVYVCTGASPAYALWGGLMSARAMSLGAVGAVVDGHHRDTRERFSASDSRSSPPAPMRRTSGCAAGSSITAVRSRSGTAARSLRAT
jgi:hypothetical protein